jgi:uncharacterized protein (TIGR02145 family)
MLFKKLKYIFILCIMFLFFKNSCNYSKNNKVVNNEIDTNIVKDIDGNIYHKVNIGGQTWLKENLKVTHFSNGDPIPQIKDDIEWANDTIGAYCDYNNDTSISAVYGKLYNWYAVDDKRGVCPNGWHVATYDEFSELCYLYQSPFDCGKYLKEAGTAHWKDSSDATNISGFTALPGGHRDKKGFWWLGAYAFFWNREEYKGEYYLSEQDGGCAYECSFQPGTYFNHDWGYKYRGMSVRCVKDSTEIN